MGEFTGGILRSLRSTRSTLTDHFLSEYGFSLLTVLAAQFTGKQLVGGGEGVIRMLKNDTIRAILESGGFVLEEVLQDAGFMLKVLAPGICSSSYGVHRAGFPIGTCNRLSAKARWMQSQEDGELASSHASDGTLAESKSLANVYKLGERRWRRNSKRAEACAYTARFTAMKQRWRSGADVQDGGAESST